MWTNLLSVAAASFFPLSSGVASLGSASQKPPFLACGGLKGSSSPYRLLGGPAGTCGRKEHPFHREYAQCWRFAACKTWDYEAGFGWRLGLALGSQPDQNHSWHA
jgi:hypothetical protein